MELRDKLNTKEGYQEIVDLDIKFIKDGYDKINALLEDEKNGIQKFPKPNLKVIESTKDTLLNYQYEIMIAKYSQGLDMHEIKKNYLSIIPLMRDNWKQINGYVPMVQMLSIGIMLGIEYVPALPLGGKASNNNLQVVDAKSYIHIIGQAAGKIVDLG